MNKQKIINRLIAKIIAYNSPKLIDVAYNARNVIEIDSIAPNLFGVKVSSVNPNNLSVKCKVLIRFLTNPKMRLTLNTLTLNFIEMITPNTFTRISFNLKKM